MKIDKITAIGGTNILGALNTYIHKKEDLDLFLSNELYE